MSVLGDFDIMYPLIIGKAPKLFKAMKNSSNVEFVNKGLEWISKMVLDGDDGEIDVDSCGDLMARSVGDTIKLSMETFARNVTIQSLGCEILYHLSPSHEMNGVVLVGSGLGKCVISALSEHHQHSQLVTKALKVLSLFVKTKSNVSRLKTDGLSDRLFEGIEDNIGEVASIKEALVRFGRDSGPYPTRSGNRRRAVAQMSAIELPNEDPMENLKLVVNYIPVYQSNSKTVADCFEWIFDVIDEFQDDARKKLYELDICQMVKLGMEKNQADETVQSSGCNLLYQLTDNEERAKLLVVMGFGRIVIEAMVNYSNSARIQHLGCQALVEFIRVDSCVSTLQDQGLTDDLVAKARTVMRNENFQIECTKSIIQALRLRRGEDFEVNFKYAPFGSEIKYAPKVIQFFRKNMKKEKIVRNCLMWVNDRVRRGSEMDLNLLMENGCPEAIKLGMVDHIQNYEVTFYAISAQFYLAVNNPRRSAELLEIGLGKCLIDAMKKNPDDANVQGNSCLLLDEFLGSRENPTFKGNLSKLKQQGLNENLIDNAIEVLINNGVNETVIAEAIKYQLQPQNPKEEQLDSMMFTNLGVQEHSYTNPKHSPTSSSSSSNIRALPNSSTVKFGNRSPSPTQSLSASRAAYSESTSGAKGSSSIESTPKENVTYQNAADATSSASKRMKPNSPKYVCFWSFDPLEALKDARYLQILFENQKHNDILEPLNNSETFLDYDDSRELNEIPDDLMESKVLVVLLSKNYFKQPKNLYILSLAMSHKVPIIPIKIEGCGYDVNDAKDILRNLTHETFERQGKIRIDVPSFQRELATSLSSWRPLPLDISGSKERLLGDLETIRKRIVEKANQQ